jgi:quinol monooxygenase YgiN
MYGMVARLRVKPGNETQMTAVSREYDQEPIAGAVARYLLQADTDAHEFYLMAVFESQETYRANAGSPAQHARYLKLRELLERDPEWHDGTVVWSWPSRS